MNPHPTSDESRPARESWRLLAVPVLAMTALAAGAHVLATRREDWQPWLGSLGAWTPVPYLLLWLLAVPAGLPAAALGLTAGFLFGPLAGSGWALLGLAMSGLFMHALGRRWLRPRVGRLAAGRPNLARLQGAAAAGGFRWHALARLSPLNYALVSYTLAAGGAPLRPYACGLVGAVPGLSAYVWLGAAARQGAGGGGGGDIVRLVLVAGSGCGLLGLGWWLARASRRGKA
ncbi:MAG: TVP38/TMEM64 family protein [bacterium]|nr:TVP38/TMEM64 family protein [bacterium]